MADFISLDNEGKTLMGGYNYLLCICLSMKICPSVI